MKRLHRPDLYSWSVFNEERNIDFHSVLWHRKEGNIVIDPLPLSDHDLEHLKSLGNLASIIITNSDHVRNAEKLKELTGAKIFGPAGEKDNFPIACDAWLEDGDDVVSGLKVLELDGSKTPGELALLLEENTLIMGDLIRSHQGGKLCLLPEEKLKDKKQALASLKDLASLDSITVVLPGDGWPVFCCGHKALLDLVKEVS